jgi:hypothetical protein
MAESGSFLQSETGCRRLGVPLPTSERLESGAKKETLRATSLQYYNTGLFIHCDTQSSPGKAQVGQAFYHCLKASLTAGATTVPKSSIDFRIFE